MSAQQFVERYDAAPIRADDAPPTFLKEAARSAGTVVASDLARAITSAQALAPGRDVITTPLLRELSFDVPSWGPKLPLRVWDGLHHLAWTMRLLMRAENEHTRRAVLAAEWLEAHASTTGTTLVITHGGFRRLVHAQLLHRGWRSHGLWHRYHNWSVWNIRST